MPLRDSNSVSGLGFSSNPLPTPGLDGTQAPSASDHQSAPVSAPASEQVIAPLANDNRTTAVLESQGSVPTLKALQKISSKGHLASNSSTAALGLAPAIDAESVSAVRLGVATLEQRARAGRQRYAALIAASEDQPARDMYSFMMTVDPFGICCDRNGEAMQPSNPVTVRSKRALEALDTLLGDSPDYDTIIREFDMVGGQHPPVDAVSVTYRDKQGNRHSGSSPQLIHSIWLGGPLTDPDRRENIAKLANANENFRTILWTDQRPNLPGFEEMKAWAAGNNIALMPLAEVLSADRDTPLFAIRNLETVLSQWGAVSDIVRMRILDLFGGVYVDADNQVNEDQPEIKTEAMLQGSGFACPLSPTRRASNNDVLVSVRKHPICSKYHDEVVNAYTSPHLDEDEMSVAVPVHKAVRARLFGWGQFYSESEVIDNLPAFAEKARVMRQTGPEVMQTATHGWNCGDSLHREHAFVGRGGMEGAYLKAHRKTPNNTLEEEITALLVYAHDWFVKWGARPHLSPTSDVLAQRVAEIERLGYNASDLRDFIERLAGDYPAEDSPRGARAPARPQPPDNPHTWLSDLVDVLGFMGKK